jgi:hypothetical protein
MEPTFESSLVDLAQFLPVARGFHNELPNPGEESNARRPQLHSLQAPRLIIALRTATTQVHFKNIRPNGRIGFQKDPAYTPAGFRTEFERLFLE